MAGESAISTAGPFGKRPSRARARSALASRRLAGARAGFSSAATTACQPHSHSEPSLSGGLLPGPARPRGACEKPSRGGRLRSLRSKEDDTIRRAPNWGLEASAPRADCALAFVGEGSGGFCLKGSRFARRPFRRRARRSEARAGECPERQRGRTVNPLAYAFAGSSPASPTTRNGRPADRLQTTP